MVDQAVSVVESQRWNFLLQITQNISNLYKRRSRFSHKRTRDKESICSGKRNKKNEENNKKQCIKCIAQCHALPYICERTLSCYA